MDKLQLSICIPLYNESESLPELYTWISKVMLKHLFSYEVIFVDDGSTDNSWEIIDRLSKENDAIKGIKFRRNYGKSARTLLVIRFASRLINMIIGTAKLKNNAVMKGTL